MVNIQPKSVATMKLSGQALNHARTDVAVRGLTAIVDEPEERGGTNQGPTPTETLVVALTGCLNVVSHRISDTIGIELNDMSFDVAAQFDRRGVMQEEAIAVPFPRIDVTINATTNGSDEQIERLKADLAKYCPLSMLIRQSGTELNETWNLTRA
jgi:uncharacterized OsmC-like protein